MSATTNKRLHELEQQQGELVELFIRKIVLYNDKIEIYFNMGHHCKKVGAHPVIECAPFFLSVKIHSSQTSVPFSSRMARNTGCSLRVPTGLLGE